MYPFIVTRTLGAVMEPRGVFAVQDERVVDEGASDRQGVCVWRFRPEEMESLRRDIINL